MNDDNYSNKATRRLLTLSHRKDNCSTASSKLIDITAVSE